MKVFKLHQEVCGTDEPNDTLTDYKSVKSKVKIKEVPLIVVIKTMLKQQSY